MTVCVGGYWEHGWDVPKQEYERWQHMLKEFSVDELHMAPISGIMTGLSQTFLTEHTDLETLIADARTAGKTIVFVDEAATVELADFTHPSDVLYITGKTGLSPYSAYHDAGQGDQAVKITTVANTGGLWSYEVMTVILYDRLVKAS